MSALQTGAKKGEPMQQNKISGAEYSQNAKTIPKGGNTRYNVTEKASVKTFRIHAKGER